MFFNANKRGKCLYRAKSVMEGKVYLQWQFCCVVMQMVIKNFILWLPKSLKNHPTWKSYTLSLQPQT
jgi:hypothetical protein